MTDAPAIAVPTPSPSPEAHWSHAYGLRQLQMLGELAEIGLDVARAVERYASGQPAAQDAPEPVFQEPVFQEPVFQGDPALAYSRVSRAVRLTLMLQAKLIEDLKAAEAGVEAKAQQAREEADPAYQAKARAEIIVGRIARRSHAGDQPRLDRLTREAAERLDDEDLYGDLLERPLSEIVARLCQDLGLDPDWSELAEELWAVREAESGHVGWPLKELRQRPPPPAGVDENRIRFSSTAQRAGGGVRSAPTPNSPLFTDSA